MKEYHNKNEDGRIYSESNVLFIISVVNDHSDHHRQSE